MFVAPTTLGTGIAVAFGIAHDASRVFAVEILVEPRRGDPVGDCVYYFLIT